MKTVRLAGGLLILSLVLVSCQPTQEIELKSVDSFRVTAVENNQLFAELQLTLWNPNSYSFNVKNADIDVFLNEFKLGKTELEEPWKIPKNSTLQHTVKLRAELDKSFQQKLPQLALAALGNNLRVKMQGEVKGSVFLFSRSFPVEAEERIDLSDFKINL